MAVASAAALVVAGCSTGTLDAAKAERIIKSGVARTTGHSVSVSCPANIPESKGRVTACTVSAADGSKVTVRIVQKDDNGRIDVSLPLVATASLEQRISANATSQSGFTVTVTCPQLYEVTNANQIEECQATSAKAKPVLVPVSITNYGGRFNYRWHIG
jgi:hypothetical protein